MLKECFDSGRSSTSFCTANNSGVSSTSEPRFPWCKLAAALLRFSLLNGRKNSEVLESHFGREGMNKLSRKSKYQKKRGKYSKREVKRVIDLCALFYFKFVI